MEAWSGGLKIGQNSMMLGVNKRERQAGDETQVITWARSPRQARNRDIPGEKNGPGASDRERRRTQQELEASQSSLSPGRKGEVTKRLS